jgi:hypothetical protein
MKITSSWSGLNRKIDFSNLINLLKLDKTLKNRKSIINQHSMSLS